MKLTALTLTSLLSVSAVAIAENSTPTEKAMEAHAEVVAQEEQKAPSIFEKLDANKDGKVSPQEAQVSPALVKGFEKIDINKDGFLTPEEFSQLQVETSQENASLTKTLVVA